MKKLRVGGKGQFPADVTLQFQKRGLERYTKYQLGIQRIV